MQCRLPRTIKPLFDVVLSGTFGYYGYVTIDGTQYTSAQTVKVAKGTSVTVYCGSYSGTEQKNSEINLNGTRVAKGTSSAGAEYTFAVTDNCTITVTKAGTGSTSYYTAAITMPA